MLMIPYGRICAQKLKPGFQKKEYLELLKLTAKHTNPDFFKTVPAPDHFLLQYRSPIVGLDNAWELWLSKDKTAAISIRGTTAKAESWLANFYAAMVPAKGRLQLSAGNVFEYELAQNPKAAVHVGWLLSLASMAPDIVRHVDSCYKNGVRDIYIVGHSQGGGISFLLTAYLYNLQMKKLLPSDIRFKTYCSAGPKPGNLYFAYDYEAMTQEGWAYNVVSSNDWVPEVPFTVQTTNDFVAINPFAGARAMIKKQKFPGNIALKYVYNRLDRPSKRAQKNYQKYLGKMMSRYVRKNIKDFHPPKYYNSNNYVRTGHAIVLLGDKDYFKDYPEQSNNLFLHHMPDAYYALAVKMNLP